MHTALAAHPDAFDAAAAALVGAAQARGSSDDLTLQIVRVDALPDAQVHRLHRQRDGLALPPPLLPRRAFEGYTIVRELQASARSHIHLELDPASGRHVVLKTPSVELRENPAYLDRFMLEEWVARRLDSPHVLKPCATDRPRRHLYVAMEYIDGQTLAQWMTDHARPDLDSVRSIVEQVAKGLQAFHRKEMLHQDLRPDNIMIDRSGTVKIIDFGATHVAGLAEGDLPKLNYASARPARHDLPPWIDAVLRQALHPRPAKRQEALSAFVHDLRAPGPQHLKAQRSPLLERNPVLFWRSLALLLALVVVVLAGLLAGVFPERR